MLDLKWILSNFEHVQTRLATRGAVTADLSSLYDLNQQRKALQLEFDQLRAKQNEASATIQKLKKTGNSSPESQQQIEQMQGIAKRIKEIQPKLHELEVRLQELLYTFPNLPHESIPIGKTSDDNIILRSFGKRPEFRFSPKTHWDLGENLGLFDFARAAKIAGSRFTVYWGIGAKLERALIQFMLDLHTRENGYLEVLPPFLANDQSLLGTGQLPKFEEDLFQTTAGYYLIPTAEVPLTNLHRDEVLAFAQLPLLYTAYTPCFRSEAGSYGKDVRGLIRQHQFNKVEIVQFVEPEHSYQAHENLTQHAELVLQKLGLPYRVMVLCSGDLGFAAAKTYDLEVWLPGQNMYREISSCSNFEDFQARRANIRYKTKDGKTAYVHTLNGSGLAVGRTVMAILENYQQEDGSIRVPDVLVSYLGGIDVIR